MTLYLQHAQSHDVYIAIGSNIENPVIQVCSAIKSLQQESKVSVEKVSSWYKSTAVGPSGQPDYLNGVVYIKTQLNPENLLNLLKKIENFHGRKRKIKWGARSLDLDIILFDDLNINSLNLVIPHPMATQRNFVIYPLAEINHSIKIHDKTIKEIQQQLDSNGLTKLSNINDYNQKPPYKQ